MALSRSRMAAARGIQSRRRVRFCLPDNEPDHTKEIRWKKILLESEDPTHNKDSEKTQEA